MTYDRLPYDDAATTTEMMSDGAAAGRALHLPTQPSPGKHSLDGLREPLPFATPVVSDDLAELAAGLELHFD